MASTQDWFQYCCRQTHLHVAPPPEPELDSDRPRFQALIISGNDQKLWPVGSVSSSLYFELYYFPNFWDFLLRISLMHLLMDR